MRAVPVLAAFLLLAAAPARARAVDGVVFADSVMENGHQLVLNGVGTRVFALVVDGYASALYLPRPAHTAAEILAEPGPKLLLTRFLHAASVAQIRGEFAAIHDRYCAAHPCSAASRATFDTVSNSVQPVKPGETAAYLIYDGTLSISVDDRPVLVVHDPDYTRGMLESLLGAASPTAGYRNGLLGMK